MDAVAREDAARDARMMREVYKGFAAKYPGTCAVCGRQIKVGERIQMWSRPKVAHKECVATMR
jgi:Zn ribbon nucleic-acid-binding protein